MKQRMGDRSNRRIEEHCGYPVMSAWHRGGRNPRYYDVYFYSASLDERDGGPVGMYYPPIKNKQKKRRKHALSI